MRRTIRWLHVNLFAKPFDAVLTLVTLPLLAWAGWEFLRWALMLANWSVVTGSLRVLLTGLFPADKLWLVWVSAVLIAGLCVLALFERRFPAMGRRLPMLAFATLAAVLLILSPAGPSTWGGLLLSVVITLTAALLTLPLGVVLAFGRQSRSASLSALCTAYIEVMRSVPLILVVYCIWVAFPLILPSLPLPDVVRGLIGFTLFYSAYAAEFIRSGLQSVPRGQVEAAEAIGLSDWDVKRIVILPQALRVAVPGLVGNILDIFNYAPLVFIIGLTDFLRAGQMILANPENSGRTYEIYVFLFLAYFAVGSMITFQARRLEQKLGKGAH